jgi:hypothetical protein
LDVTFNSSQDLRDINNFEVEPDNAYLDERQYYALINNCNYLISLVDTSLVLPNRNNDYIREKLLQREMAATKAIRAWAYLQLCLNYGHAYYYEEPLLKGNEDFTAYERMELDGLTSVLIDDLLPWKPVDGDVEHLPNYGNIDGFASTGLFMPVRFILGELYMWKKDYANAANMYYQTIVNYAGYRLMVAGLDNTWSSGQFQSYGRTNWRQLFTNSATEMLSRIAYTPDYTDNLTRLPAMFQTDYVLAPSTAAVENFNAQTYSVSAEISRPGDLRGLCGNAGSYIAQSLIADNDAVFPVVTKYDAMQDYTVLCRASLVYLRYAEAINRLGKPVTAFAMLKYGLKKSTIDQNVPNREKTGEPFLEFGQSNTNLENAFSGNTGMHTRGCGNVSLSNSYAIPTGVDSLLWVEDQLVMEYALETAFEGNRFGDLMRIANHRNDPSFLAKTVTAKFPESERNAMILKLSDKNNWYLPEEK